MSAVPHTSALRSFYWCPSKNLTLAHCPLYLIHQHCVHFIGASVRIWPWLSIHCILYVSIVFAFSVHHWWFWSWHRVSAACHEVQRSSRQNPGWQRWPLEGTTYVVQFYVSLLLDLKNISPLIHDFLQGGKKGDPALNCQCDLWARNETTAFGGLLPVLA